MRSRHFERRRRQKRKQRRPGDLFFKTLNLFKSRHISPLQIFDFFVQRCRHNTRVVLCMSPIGDILRNSLRQFPSLINCCTISWFDPWPEEGLDAVASSCLGRVEYLSKLPVLRQHLVYACSAMHTYARSVCASYLASDGRYA